MRQNVPISTATTPTTTPRGIPITVIRPTAVVSTAPENSRSTVSRRNTTKDTSAINVKRASLGELRMRPEAKSASVTPKTTRVATTAWMTMPGYRVSKAAEIAPRASPSNAA